MFQVPIISPMQSTAGGPLLGVNEIISLKSRPTIRTEEETRHPGLPSNVKTPREGKIYWSNKTM